MAKASAPPNAALFITVLAAWLYAGITGWQAPVLRSAAGMTLYGIARCFYRGGRLLNILAAVAIAFAAVDPGRRGVGAAQSTRALHPGEVPGARRD